jgi:hypothetical protein
MTTRKTETLRHRGKRIKPVDSVSSAKHSYRRPPWDRDDEAALNRGRAESLAVATADLVGARACSPSLTSRFPRVDLAGVNTGPLASHHTVGGFSPISVFALDDPDKVMVCFRCSPEMAAGLISVRINCGVNA